MARLLTLPSGRTARWIIAVAWLLVAFVSIGANLPGKFADAEENESTSFLPGDAESTKALEAATRLQNGEQAPMVAVFRRAGGLTAADQRTIARRGERFNAPPAPLAAAGKDPLQRTTGLEPGAPVPR